MMISITTRTRQGEKRHFTCRTETLEAGLESVNGIAVTGDYLLRVHLFDEASLIALPVEAFDGQPMEEPLTTLKREWVAILQKPVDLESVQRQYLMSHNRDHLGRQNAYIVRIEEAIATMEQYLGNLQSPSSGRSTSSRLEEYLTRTLVQYQRQLATAINRRGLILDQFAQLQGW